MIAVPTYILLIPINEAKHILHLSKRYYNRHKLVGIRLDGTVAPTMAFLGILTGFR